MITLNLASAPRASTKEVIIVGKSPSKVADASRVKSTVGGRFQISGCQPALSDHPDNVSRRESPFTAISFSLAVDFCIEMYESNLSKLDSASAECAIFENNPQASTAVVSNFNIV